MIDAPLVQRGRAFVGPMLRPPFRSMRREYLPMSSSGSANGRTGFDWLSGATSL